MIKVFADSGCSIKKDELEKYGVEILPLKILLGDKEYLDGVDLEMDVFYHELIDFKLFPKTSLPSLEDAENRVNQWVDKGYDVLVLTISSGISGTNNALKMIFNGNEKVRVIDTKTAVGGMRILIREINKYLDKSLDFVEEKLNDIIPRIKALAVPETLDYLFKGGRLSRVSYAIGSLLKIKPVICLKDKVFAAGKTIGLKSAMKFIVSALDNCDTDYPIVPSYTYKDDNLKVLIEKTPDYLKEIMIEFDNLDPAIACHWGPNAFGYFYVEKKQ